MLNGHEVEFASQLINLVQEDLDAFDGECRGSEREGHLSQLEQRVHEVVKRERR